MMCVLVQAEIRVLALLPSGCMVSVDSQGNIAHWSLPDSDDDQSQQPLKRFKLPQHLLLPCPQYVLPLPVRPGPALQQHTVLYRRYQWLYILERMHSPMHLICMASSLHNI